MHNSFLDFCQDDMQTQGSDNKDISKTNLSENYSLVRDLVILSKTDSEAKKFLNLVKTEIKNASLP
ncbi:hypothetical protein [Brevibacillus laterosporus]|uniref:hypothetical protein n=1 Tax=Brevibacillus laterosporus TaxID=1465 RepID=UPI000E6D3F15|nr:hypothetical protein [Brevibacillus laterosporus]AYB41423.1 hypothetical protein D5F52_26115 [Brevibacillus laterosporus]AYK08906.1 hypothetical protein D8Z77_22560 [Brevibacillus laterosporus]